MRWETIAVISGIISLIIGLMCICAGIINNVELAEPKSLNGILLFLGLLGTVGGVTGLTGAHFADSNTESAKKLLTAAAICMIPHGLIFFALFMVSKNRMFPKEDYWSMDEESGENERGETETE